MPRLAVACLAALPIAGALLFACTSFSSDQKDNPAPDTGTTVPVKDASSDAGPPLVVEAGPDAFSQGAAEYDVDLNDGGTLHCWNFGLTIGGYIIDGEAAVTYHPELGGYLISIASTDFAQIHTTVDAGRDIHVSTLRIDERVTITGSYDAGVFTDGFAQYLGGVDDNVPRNAIAYAAEGAEINEWPQAGPDPHGFDSLPTANLPLATIDGPVWIDTVWADATGSVTISAGGKVVQSTHSTSTQPASRAYTLKIGGALHGDKTPSVNVLVRSICLGFR